MNLYQTSLLLERKLPNMCDGPLRRRDMPSLICELSVERKGLLVAFRRWALAANPDVGVSENKPTGI